MRAAWHTATRSAITLRTISFIAALIAALLLPMLANPDKVHAICGTTCTYSDSWGTQEVAGSGWMGGNGVPIYSNGPNAPLGPSPDTINYVNNINGVSTQSGIEWQCVELVNRLYLTKGWTTAWWSGYGYQMYGTAPSGLAKQAQGSITYISPGDVIGMSGGGSGFGHVAVVSSVSGSSVTIASQNTNAVYDTSFGLSNGSITYSGWTNYTMQGVIHAPASSSTSGGFPSSAVMDFNSKENVVARGINNEAYINTWQSGMGWSGFSSIQSGAVFAGNPTAVKFNSDGYIFARGTNNEIYKSISSGGSAWGGFTSLQSGATFASDPVAIQFDSSTLNVFAVGTDGQMYENTKLSSGWTGFSLLQAGSYFVGNPTVMRFNSKEYVVGRGINNEIYVDTWTSGTGWSGFTRIAPGSTFASDPTVFVFNNVLNIFARGTDNQMYVNYWTTGTGWSGFSSLSTSTFTGNPVAIQYGTVLNIFARGTDNQMYVNYYDTSWHSFSLIQSGAVFNGFSWL